MWETNLVDRFEELLSMQRELIAKAPHELTPAQSAYAVSGLGIIEETLEFLSAAGWKPWRPIPLPRESQLEELVDVLFFYLEMVFWSGFTWDQIVERYKTKHAENLKRYEDGAKGDYSWDKRAEKGGL